jgi:hypothetical protein
VKKMERCKEKHNEIVRKGKENKKRQANYILE